MFRIIDRTDCWDDLGTPKGHGYRTAQWNGQHEYLHRLSYQAFIGPIPEGLVIDHLCRNRACCNPGHLEAITNAENILRGSGASARNARKASCPKCGGPYVQHAGGRRCLPCKQAIRTDTKNLGVGRPGDRQSCPRGHPYDEENTYIVRRPDGSVKNRMCRECGRQRVRARRAREREVMPGGLQDH